MTKLNPAGLDTYEEVRSSFHHKWYPPLNADHFTLLLRCMLAARQFFGEPSPVPHQRKERPYELEDWHLTTWPASSYPYPTPCEEEI